MVVFRHPVNGADFIKRLIGLPGDRIQMTDGMLYINGEPVPQEPAGIFVEMFEQQGPVGNLPALRERRASALGGDCVKARCLETLPNGVKHDILNIGDEPARQHAGLHRARGALLLHGRQPRQLRPTAASARPRGGVGFVPCENLIGRADRVMFSSAGRSMLFFWTWRPDRFFKAIE